MSMDLEQFNNTLIKKFQQSPVYFIKVMWQLEPQKVKDEHKEFVDICIKNGNWNQIQKDHFAPFVKGKNLTWQQWLMLLAVERAIVYGKNKISIVAGHGVGKSSCLSWLIIWYLFCHLDAQVGATAPTSEQIHDVLWKEAALWLGKMPAELREQNIFEWQGGYIRVRERPETWFARARTARKEAPEAIAGLHGENVLILVDEASGVPDEIYRSAEGSMTGPNVIAILIGNGTRNTGYFYDSHHTDAKNWQNMSFSSEESPIVEDGYVERMEAKYGRESEEFNIRVAGGFPASEQMDDAGWVPLIVNEQVKQIQEGLRFSGRKIMGIDPSGEGDDTTRWVLRDNFQARVIATEATSNEKAIARRTMDLVQEYEMEWEDVVVDNFGVGANVAKELLLLDHEANVTAMNWGEGADDEDVYLNKRAECCFRGRDWLIRGGAIVGDELKRDVVAYPYRNTLSGKKQIMDKPKIKKRLGRSPDRGDAFFMTFYFDVDLRKYDAGGVVTQSTKKDLHSAI